MPTDADFLRRHLRHTLEERRGMVDAQQRRSPHLVPVIVTIDGAVFDLRVHKFAFASDTPMFAVMNKLRNYLRPAMSDAESLSAMAMANPHKRTNNGGVLLMASATIGQACRDHAWEDGFLYIRLLLMNTFGCNVLTWH